MKRLLLISILLGSIILAGCGKQQGLSQDELFEKKQECIKYKNDLQDRIDKDTQEFKEVGAFYSEGIEEIFYSESENSCFAITKEILKWNSNSESESRKRIIDLLTNNSTNYEDDQMIYYSEKIKHLKWE